MNRINEQKNDFLNLKMHLLDVHVKWMHDCCCCFFFDSLLMKFFSNIDLLLLWPVLQLYRQVLFLRMNSSRFNWYMSGKHGRIYGAMCKLIKKKRWNRSKSAKRKFRNSMKIIFYFFLYSIVDVLGKLLS